MPLRIQTRLGSVLRLRRRRRHGSCRLDSTEVACKHQADETSTQASKDVAPVAEQEGSRFLQKLPIEIRRMIYTLIWEDHDRQYHLFLDNGRLRRLKCVKHHSDDDEDAIQKAMDVVYESQSPGMVTHAQLRLWRRRLASTWGCRHWRYPEIMASIFESHTFLFNDISSAHHFFVVKSSSFLGSIRSLDISLVLPYVEYRSYSHAGGPQPATRLDAIQEALARITFRDLRISLDVQDRQCWRQIPEAVILNSLGEVRVLNRGIVELPALFPGSRDQHWELNGGNERLTWNAAKGTDTSCWIASDSMGYIPNPWSDASVNQKTWLTWVMLTPTYDTSSTPPLRRADWLRFRITHEGARLAASPLQHEGRAAWYAMLPALLLPQVASAATPPLDLSPGLLAEVGKQVQHSVASHTDQ
ncbi:hypothetical protein PG999_009147 [Apiospora kogelbergensis]|uniref:DUF7730 domain-containing protein n=1 Tax=Apiospora kogelbergensis TaxID=1337665 RepID=A0AAW0QT03_9PEZI